MGQPNLKQIIQLQSVLFNNLTVENLDSEMLQSLINNPRESGEQFTHFLQTGGKLVAQNGPSISTPSGIIEVDYNQTFEDMLKAGHYDWTNTDITEKRFPVKGEGIVKYETKLFHFGKDVSSEFAENAIRNEDMENPWEPAKTEHTLSYGAQFPEEQRKYPIVGLGISARVRGARRVLYLFESALERDLFLAWWDDDWVGNYRFLAVRKVSVSQT